MFAKKNITDKKIVVTKSLDFYKNILDVILF